MFEKESLTTDVLVIGAGVAGLMAALEARKVGAKVTIVSKGPLGKLAATYYSGGALIPDSRKKKGVNIPGYKDGPGFQIEDSLLVKTIVEQAPKQLDNLRSYGAVVLERGGGFIVEGTKKIGGASICRALTPVVKKNGIKAVEGCRVLGLLKDNGRVTGAYGLLKDGKWLHIYSRSTVLATGGGAAIYRVTSNPQAIVGDGYVMALKAGVQLSNIEFSQFYPVGLFRSPLSYIHCGAPTLLMKNAKIINLKGEDIVRKHFSISLPEGADIPTIRFQWISKAVAEELEEGPVFLDLTQVPQESWDRLDERSKKKLEACNVNAKERPIPILHMGHGFKGGIPVDPNCATSLEGFFAAGEVVSGYSAGDKGAGQLCSCLTLGGVAGQNAANSALQVPSPPKKNGAEKEIKEIETLFSKKGWINPTELRDEAKRIIYHYAGPIRNGTQLQAGIGNLQVLAEFMKDIRCRSLGNLEDALETSSIILLGQALMKAALLRKESRFTHFRKDFPQQDDKNYLRPVLVSYDEEIKEIKGELGQFWKGGPSQKWSSCFPSF